MRLVCEDRRRRRAAWAAAAGIFKIEQAHDLFHWASARDQNQTGSFRNKTLAVDSVCCVITLKPMLGYIDI